jgi:DHA3 family macrolide efflux protein-like MFS transporter
MRTLRAPWTDDNWKGRFFTLWTGQAVSTLGSMLVQFALVWWLTQSTGSATVLATATLAAILPQVFLSPVAGALVDRWNRRAVMMASDSLVSAMALVLVFLFATGAQQVWHIYVLMFARSALGAFQWPAMSASTSLMVPDRHLSRIAGLNQALHGAMNIIAPPVGALLLGVLPMPAILAVDVVTALAAVLPLAFIRVPQPGDARGQKDPAMLHAAPAASGAKKATLGQDLRAGLRYVAGWPGLLMILAMATLINFLMNPAFSLLPILVTRHFGGQAMELAAINSVWGIGVVTGGLLLGAWGGFKRRIVTTMMGLSLMGAGTVLIGLAPTGLFGLAMAGMLLSGVMNPITNGPLFALVQSNVAPDMQGRVMSLANAAATAASPLSLLVAGPVADAIGVQAWYVVGGLTCVALGIGSFFVPAIMNVEQGRGRPAAAPAQQPGGVAPEIGDSRLEIRGEVSQ